MVKNSANKSSNNTSSSTNTNNLLKSQQLAAQQAEAARLAAEAQLKARYKALKGQLTSCSSNLASVINAVNSLYSIMKSNVIIDGKTLEEAKLNQLKANSASIKSSVDGIISSIESKC